MSDCLAPEFKDRLPDLLALDAGSWDAELRAHLAACASCRDELAALRIVHGVLAQPGGQPSRIDSATIAAAIPPYAPRGTWQRLTRPPMLRAAAAVVLLAGGVAVGYGHLGDAGNGSTNGASVSTTELAIGDNFSDLSDADLRALAEELGSLRAIPMEEPDVVPLPGLEDDG